MDINRDIVKQYFRTDLPKLHTYDKVEVVTKSLNKNEKGKHRLIRIEGIVIAQKNQGQISYTFSVLTESSKIAIKNTFYYHSPLIVSIKKIGGVKLKSHRA